MIETNRLFITSHYVLNHIQPWLSGHVEAEVVKPAFQVMYAVPFHDMMLREATKDREHYITTTAV